jgi:ribonuclease P/MRP protein subunit RPP1
VQHSNNPTVNAFDLLAVRTSNEKVFASACANYEIDIISLECSSRLPFFLKNSTLGQALDREVYFEVCYAGGIRGEHLPLHV